MTITRSTIRRIWRRALARVVLGLGLAGLGFTSVAADAQTLLQANARYPRVRLLASGELIATVLLSPGDFSVKVFSSTNNGTSWTAVGSISDSTFPTKFTSSPDFIQMPNGDLILGINYDTQICTGCQSTIRIYRSTDAGRNWTYISDAAVSPNGKRYWEPNFSIASDGTTLVLTYSDETSGCCSQKLVKVRSTDGGYHWNDRANLVAIMSEPELRPGMPVVTKLKDGTNRYLLTYEMCKLAGRASCQTYYKTSTDGWNYGADNTYGTAMTRADGRFWRASPMVKALPTGPLMWVAQVLSTTALDSAPGDGQVLFKSMSGSPDGPWIQIPAPVPLPNPILFGCEGFSPSLQWVNGGSTLVQLTTRKHANDQFCDVYVGTGPS